MIDSPFGIWADDARLQGPRMSQTNPAALALTLREIAERYAKGCPFKVGDLITPRRGYNINGDGEPHVVLEVFADPRPCKDPECPHPHMDLRIAFEDGKGEIVAMFTESWAYEPYAGAVLDIGEMKA